MLFPLQTKGAQVLAVGVGAGADESELKTIAMGNSENVLKMGSFGQLARSLRTVTKNLCQGMDESCLHSEILNDRNSKSSIETEHYYHNYGNSEDKDTKIKRNEL